MKFLFLFVFSIAVLLSLCWTANQDQIVDSLVISKVDRDIDLTSQLVKISHTISLENNGKTGVRSFLFAVEPSSGNHLSFIGAMSKGDEEGDVEPLDVSRTTVSEEKDKIFFRIKLKDSLGAGKSTSVDVETVFTHFLHPYPSSITQSEHQLVLFTGNAYFYSPYKTVTQKTLVKLASSTIESYSKVKPVSLSESEITYGPYENTEPFREEELKVHYENGTPFLSVTSLNRLIEVSHWGNIAVEENVEIRHTGAILKGPFSRYEYQKDKSGFNSVWSFKTLLPASAADVYYRDEIGNISTSHLRELVDSVEVDLRPRFPLFGGWKTKYMIGYNLPSYEYLFNEGDKYVLRIRFVDHIYDDQQIDQAYLRVILPEGAENIELKTPFEVFQGKIERHFTYLDYYGRPVVTAHKSDLVEQQIQDFEVHYTFKKWRLLMEPLMVVVAFYLMFAAVIIWVRLDFSISKDAASESRMRVSSMLEQLQSVHDQRVAVYQAYDDTINKFKSSKDTAAFAANRKKNDAEYKQFTQTIADLHIKLKAEASDAADKVAELQKLDRSVKEQLQAAISYAERVVANKMLKQAYIEAESATNAKKEDLIAKMEAILESL
ncbi:PREDICTED: dolichyl-diphosphooligosaccharide--protein glycosyltransferase subunit 1-like [Priapulus caudatus]|uniref:Dolichyl-diphosphooligosaccharide--protein glycosyltransferase subunit 1 n=1 Tax=Priapulus caudatus TaxID=37621 RepID=A0ABM1EA33_PRICU|nr:PREDICTED: dolichyl-diphosphooligosaccharide--protein glycosyltransferase subunit 1-like [Priapulus caudatus]